MKVHLRVSISRYFHCAPLLCLNTGMRKLYVILFLIPFLSQAQEFPARRDSLGNYVLEEVEIQFQHDRLHRSPVPVQVLGAKAMVNSNSLSVADSVRYYSDIK